jgi:hypothetical protein
MGVQGSTKEVRTPEVSLFPPWEKHMMYPPIPMG